MKIPACSFVKAKQIGFTGGNHFTVDAVFTVPVTAIIAASNKAL